MDRAASSRVRIEVGRRCDRCARISHHPVDIREGYCPACHDWTPGDLVQVPILDRSGWLR